MHLAYHICHPTNIKNIPILWPDKQIEILLRSKDCSLKRMSACVSVFPHVSYSCSDFLQDDNAVFVLLFSTIDVENLDIELFMYHVFKVCHYYCSIKFTLLSLVAFFIQDSSIRHLPVAQLRYYSGLHVFHFKIRSSSSMVKILHWNYTGGHLCAFFDNTNPQSKYVESKVSSTLV